MVPSLRGGGVRRTAELAVKRYVAAEVAKAGSSAALSDWENLQIEGIEVSDAVGNGGPDRSLDRHSD
jgi:hypothetical protein